MLRYRTVFKAGIIFTVVLILGGFIAWHALHDNLPSPESILPQKSLQEKFSGDKKKEVRSELGRPQSKRGNCWIYEDGRVCFRKNRAK